MALPAFAAVALLGTLLLLVARSAGAGEYIATSSTGCCEWDSGGGLGNHSRVVWPADEAAEEPQTRLVPLSFAFWVEGLPFRYVSLERRGVVCLTLPSSAGSGVDQRAAPCAWAVVAGRLDEPAADVLYAHDAQLDALQVVWRVLGQDGAAEGPRPVAAVTLYSSGAVRLEYDHNSTSAAGLRVLDSGLWVGGALRVNASQLVTAGVLSMNGVSVYLCSLGDSACVSPSLSRPNATVALAFPAGGRGGSCSALHSVLDLRCSFASVAGSGGEGGGGAPPLYLTQPVYNHSSGALLCAVPSDVLDVSGAGEYVVDLYSGLLERTVPLNGSGLNGLNISAGSGGSSGAPSLSAICERCAASGHVARIDVCFVDCMGVWMGQAVLDDCLVCSNGTSEHQFNSDKDCEGVCFGGKSVCPDPNVPSLQISPPPDAMEPVTIYKLVLSIVIGIVLVVWAAQESLRWYRARQAGQHMVAARPDGHRGPRAHHEHTGDGAHLRHRREQQQQRRQEWGFRRRIFPVQQSSGPDYDRDPPRYGQPPAPQQQQQQQQQHPHQQQHQQDQAQEQAQRHGYAAGEPILSSPNLSPRVVPIDNAPS